MVPTNRIKMNPYRRHQNSFFIIKEMVTITHIKFLQTFIPVNTTNVMYPLRAK
uniref:Uncharacterized protein n=1 Tax=Anguilla anguilla TaxID=7936 RepID=A0A0E9QWN1_ANGAN